MLEKIICKGRDEVDREFYCSYELLENGYIFYVHLNINSDSFELHLEKLDENIFWCKFMGHRGDYEMRGMGVPEATIVHASSFLMSTITSTKTFSDDENYWRSEEATKVWRRLVKNGRAIYLEEKDIFQTC